MSDDNNDDDDEQLCDYCGNDESNHDDGAEVTCAAGCGAVVFLGCFKDSSWCT